MSYDITLKREKRILRPVECRDIIGIFLDRYASTFRLDWEKEFGDLYKADRKQTLYQFQEGDPIKIGISSLILNDFSRDCYIKEMFIARYEVGEGVGTHRDFMYYEKESPYRNKRFINFSIPLNSSFEGGILLVNGEEVTPQIGVATFFDVNAEHEVTRVTEGTRFSLIGWIYK